MRQTVNQCSIHYIKQMSVRIFVFTALILWRVRAKSSDSLDAIRTDMSGELARNQNINISDLLDQLLLGYDYHIRPDFGGPPTEVFIDFHVRSMGPISEIDMTYVMDCYFRQTWTDKRLSYKTRSLMEINANRTLSQPALALSIYMLDRIWKPPTYFLNSRQSHMHVITLPNKFVRIYSDGKVLYSSRMTITANCPMNLENFPMDTQRCPLALGSFGYSMEEVIYSWNPTRKVVINPDMKMSQFDLISVPVTNRTNEGRKDGPYSILLASFHFQRHMGSFVIEVYAPCIMLVVLSWVSFWINREATGIAINFIFQSFIDLFVFFRQKADRITLGLTTVLTMTFLGLELRNDLPKVPYLTALDYFVYISFAFISATILEFGFVHFFTKIGSGEYYFSPSALIELNDNNNDIDDNYSSDEDFEEDGAHSVHNVMSTELRTDNRSGHDLSEETNDNEYRIRDNNLEPPMFFHRRESEIYSTERDRNVIVLKGNDFESMSSLSSSQTSQPPIESYEYEYDIQQPTTSTFRSSHEFPRHRCLRQKRENGHQFSRLSSIRASIRNTFSRRKSRRRQSISLQLNSVSKIDRISRVIFPLAFIIMNLVYWFTFLRAEMRFDQKNKFNFI